MAGEWYDEQPGLRQVFPSILQAAAEGQTTAQVWDTIRNAASTAAASTLSITLGREPSESEIAKAAGTILSGVTVQGVSKARGVAGAMVRAHAQLSSADPNAQITADMIGTPPWSQTVGAAGVQTQYRISVQREITVHGFTAITRTEWATYNLSGPLTTMADALAQANSLFQAADYNKSVDINQILDASITTI